MCGKWTKDWLIENKDSDHWGNSPQHNIESYSGLSNSEYSWFDT